MQDRRAIEHREARCSVGHHTLALGRTDRLAEVGFGMQAVFAFPAFSCVERDHMVARFQAGDPRADFEHDARTFMAKDRGKETLGIGARERELVRVTDAGGFDLHQNLARFRAIEVHLHNL